MKIFFSSLIVFTIISFFESPTQIEKSSKKYYSGEKSIDLNDDGKDDVRWELKYITNWTNGEGFYTLLLQNNSELLYNSRLGYPSFEKGDTIKYEVNQPFRWSHFGADLASMNMDTGQWIGKTGFLPIKISINDFMHCGWINLTIDTLNQKIIFNYSNYNIKANSDFIIID